MSQDQSLTADEAYKRFIDRIVDQAKCNVSTNRIRQNGHAERLNEADMPLTAPEAARKNLLLSLSVDERQVLVEMLQAQRESALHDLLTMIEGEISEGSLKITSEGLPLGESPFGSYHFDFVCRCEGDNWPDTEQAQ